MVAAARFRLRQPEPERLLPVQAGAPAPRPDAASLEGHPPCDSDAGAEEATDPPMSSAGAVDDGGGGTPVAAARGAERPPPQRQPGGLAQHVKPQLARHVGPDGDAGRGGGGEGEREGEEGGGTGATSAGMSALIVLVSLSAFLTLTVAIAALAIIRRRARLPGEHQRSEKRLFTVRTHAAAQLAWPPVCVPAACMSARRAPDGCRS